MDMDEVGGWMNGSDGNKTVGCDETRKRERKEDRERKERKKVGDEKDWVGEEREESESRCRDSLSLSQSGLFSVL